MDQRYCYGHDNLFNGFSAGYGIFLRAEKLICKIIEKQNKEIQFKIKKFKFYI